MSNKRRRKLLDSLNSCYNVVLQSSAKGINTVDIAERLGVHRTTVHNYLTSLEFRGKIYNEHGVWFAKTGEHEIKSSEKEIIIELPVPKDQLVEESILEIYAKQNAEMQLPQTTEMMNLLLKKLKETRTIKIIGKNVDNLDLASLQSLILDAYETSSKLKSRNLRKHLKFLTGKGE